MNAMNVKKSMRVLIIVMMAALVAQTVSAEGDAADNEETVKAWDALGAGIAVGLAAIGAGLSQGAIGSAAVGMLAEDKSRFGHAIIFTALPESIVILGLLPLFM